MFYFLMILGLVASSIAFLLTDGRSLGSVLFWDRIDYFMDYFNSIYYSRSGPYLNFNVIYPGLITVLYSIIGVLLESTGVSFDSRWEIRASFAGIASYAIFTVVLLALLLCVLLRTKQNLKKETLLFFILILASYPMVYCLDRGNSMLISVIFSLLFFIFFNSEKKEHKYLSFLFLSIAIATKIYPAFFGILVLRDAIRNKSYKDLIPCIIICAVVFIVPFFFTDGTVLDVFRNATKYSEAVSMVGHVSLAGILETAAHGFGMRNFSIGAFSLWISLILMAVGAFVVLADKRAAYWETVSLLVCVQILSVGVAPPYVLLYMIIPAWYFLNDNSSKKNKTYLISLLLAATLVMVPGFLGLNAEHVSYMKAIAVLILTAVLLYNASKRMVASDEGIELDAPLDDRPL